MTDNLPDFEEMLKIANEVGVLTTEVAVYKNALSEVQAKITGVVMKVEDYWVGPDSKGNFKPPAFNFIESTYHKVGYDDETYEQLNHIRNHISVKLGRLEQLKLTFQVMRDMIDVWKTKQFNRNMTEY